MNNESARELNAYRAHELARAGMNIGTIHEATAAPGGGNEAAEEDGQTEDARHRDDSNADWEEGVRD